MQFNMVVMALAGASRIFELMDEESEQDGGYVTLVNAKIENGEVGECEERTNTWGMEASAQRRDANLYAAPGGHPVL